MVCGGAEAPGNSRVQPLAYHSCSCFSHTLQHTLEHTTAEAGRETARRESDASRALEWRRETLLKV